MPDSSVAIPVPAKDSTKKKKDDEKDTPADSKPVAKPNRDAKEGEELVCMAFNLVYATR